MTSWFIAKRYIQAHRRKGFLSFITTIAILGVMLGTAALIITLSVLDGFEREIKEKVIGFTSHIEVQGFQNLPLPHYAETIALVKKKIPVVRAISPFAGREGMIRSRDGVDGVFLKGIDLAHDVLASQRHVVEGTPLSIAGSPQAPILIGRRLANRLNAAIGDKLVVFALPRGVEHAGLRPRAMQFQLVGVYESGMAEFDDIYAYTRLSDAQRLLQIGNDVTGFDILVNDMTKIDTTARQIQDLLGYPHYSRTVFQLYRNLFSWVELQKELSPILLSLIILVATVNIIGTLLMFVLEKMHAIGVLKSLGASSRLIRTIFVLQGMTIAVIGVVLGNLLAFGFCWFQSTFRVMSLPSEIYYMNTVPISMRPENFALVTVLALTLCFFATLLPSRAAAKVHPVRALRFG